METAIRILPIAFYFHGLIGIEPVKVNCGGLPLAGSSPVGAIP
jgi:hypothetical protein